MGRLSRLLLLSIISTISISIVNSQWEYIEPEYICSPTISSCSTSTHSCLANPNHPQSTTDSECTPCQSSDQKYWPCDVDGLCYCWDKSLKQIPPAPSTRYYNGGEGLNVSSTMPCDIITQDVFDELAPNASSPYSYEGFCNAVNTYNDNHPTEGVFNMGNIQQQKAELAAFFGNALHESDEFKAGREYLMCADHLEMGGEIYCRPCDVSSFDWDTMTCPPGASLASEGRAFNNYCQSNLLPPEGCKCDDVYERSDDGPLAGFVKANEVFFGRGSIQLSWNYNYIRASIALTGAPQTFCQRPDLVATNEEYAWGAGLFYWMENVKNDKTCHQATLIDEDYGLTLDNINGGLECPADDHGWHGKAIQLRLNRYCRSATAIGCDKLLSLDGCMDMKKRMKQCLKEGMCNDCKVWEDSMDLDSDGVLAEDVEEGMTASTADKDEVDHWLLTANPDELTAKQQAKQQAMLEAEAAAGGQENKPDSSNQVEANKVETAETDDHWLLTANPDDLTAKQQAKQQAMLEAASAGGGQEETSNSSSDPSPTSKPTQSPTAKAVVNPTSSAASSFGVIPAPTASKPTTQLASEESSPTSPSHASAFAVTHDKGQNEPVVEQSATITLDTSSAMSSAGESPVEDEMVNWANTKLEPSDATSPADMTMPTKHPATPMPTKKPAKVINIAEAFRPSAEKEESEETMVEQLSIVESLPQKDESATTSETKLDNDPFIFSPIADVTLARSSPSSNFGSEPFIVVDMLEGDSILLQFDLSTLGDDDRIQKAILRLTTHGENDDGISHSGVYYIQPTTNEWNENEVTYDTAPKAKDVLFASVASQRDGNQYELDVAEAVTTNSVVSFRVIGTDRVRSEFSSRESSVSENSPVLLVELGAPSDIAVSSSASENATPSKQQDTVIVESTASDGTHSQSSSGVISGHIWHDKNADGIQDLAEPGLRGILVDLYHCKDDEWLEGTRSSPAGDYMFNELSEGKYYVVVTTNSDYGFTVKDAGTDKAKSSNVDTSGHGDCIELSTSSSGQLAATANAGIAEKAVIEESSQPGSPLESKSKGVDDDTNYNCRGSPCTEGEGYCRSKHNFCGPGEEYCNADSQWTSECGTEAPTYRPSAAPMTAVPTYQLDPDVNCSGDSCEEGDGTWCRSEIGYCGSGLLYCNPYSTWMPDCRVPLTSISAPTKSPIPPGTTISPTELTLTSSPMPSPTKEDDTGFSSFILPTLSQITAPKESDIDTLSKNNDKDTSDGDEDEEATIKTDESSTDIKDQPINDSAWLLIRTDITRNVGDRPCTRGVLPTLFVFAIFILRIL